MSEITRYSEFKYDAGLYADDVDGDWCKYDDITPIIQRNKEIETENSVQRLQIEHLEAELARLREQMPSIWEVLYRGKGIAYFDHVPHIGDLPANSLVRKLYAEQKPAQIPAELVRSVERLMENTEEYNGVYTVMESDFQAVSDCLDKLEEMKGSA